MRLGVAALVWSTGLVVAALGWPAYSTSATSADGVTLGHATLVEVNGARALALMAVPLFLSGVVLWAIRARRAGARWAGPLAWTAIVVLALESLVGIMTIGLFILPAPVLLTAAIRLASGTEGGAQDARGGLAPGTEGGAQDARGGLAPGT
jgi:hypothetical protein